MQFIIQEEKEDKVCQLKDMSIGKPFCFVKDKPKDLYCVIYDPAHKREEGYMNVFSFSYGIIERNEEKTQIFPVEQIRPAVFRFIDNKIGD